MGKFIGISLDVRVKQKLLADDVLRHDVHQKSMLIGHIVRRKGNHTSTLILPLLTRVSII